MRPRPAFAALVLTGGLLAACVNQPVAIHDRYNSGLLVELSAGSAPTPVQLGFVSARELYVVSPERGRIAGQPGGDAKSAIIFLQNGYNATDGYFLRHGVATGRAATNLATRPQALAKLQDFASAEPTREQMIERGEAVACLTQWLADNANNAAALDAAARTLGGPEAGFTVREWLATEVRRDQSITSDKILAVCEGA